MLKMNEISNHEKWCGEWRKKFLNITQSELKKRLPELKEEGDWLTLFQFARKFGVNKKDGQIVAMEDEKAVSCYEKLNIYTLLGHESSSAKYEDKWVKFDELKGTSIFSKAFKEGITEPFAKTFTGHMKELEEAFKKLNGKKLSWSDVGYEIKSFECIPIRFFFWEGDEEFPAQGNLLFDASATDYIHGESIVTIASVGLERLAQFAEVSKDRSAFPVF